MTVSEAARRIGKSANFVRKLIDTGQLPGRKVKGVRTIEEADLVAFTVAFTAASTEPSTDASRTLHGPLHAPSTAGRGGYPPPGTPLEVEGCMHSTVEGAVHPGVQAARSKLDALRAQIQDMEQEEAEELLAEDLRLKRRARLIKSLSARYPIQLLDQMDDHTLEHESLVVKAVQDAVRQQQERQAAMQQPSPQAVAYQQQQQQAAAAWAAWQAQAQWAAAHQAAQARAAEAQEIAALRRELEQMAREDQAWRLQRQRAESEDRMREEIATMRRQRLRQAEEHATLDVVRLLAARANGGGGDGGGWAAFARGFGAPIPAPAAPASAPTGTTGGATAPTDAAPPAAISDIEKSRG